MSSLVQDLRFACRLLLKSPGFTVASVLVLAAAIGVNSAVFTFVNAFVLRPLPGRDKPGEVVGLFSRDRAHPDSYRDFSYPTYRDIRQRADVFQDMMAFTLVFAGVREGDVSRRTLVSPITSNYFSTLGVGLAAGRSFTSEEESPGAGSLVAIVGHDFAEQHGGAASVLGSRLWINARPFTVVGVAPRRFTGTAAGIGPEFWIPTGAWETVAGDLPDAGSVKLSLTDRRNTALMIVGRLRPGLDVAAASSAVRGLGPQLEREYPAEERGQDLVVAPLARLTISSRPQSDAGSFRYSALVVAVAATVLLIAGMNLANMVLARGSARQKEVAMRVALGAGRGRVVRQLLTEGLVLSLAGGAVGLLLSYWSSRLLWTSLVALSPLPMQFDPVPDLRVLLATLLFCLVSTVVFGLGPAWKLARTPVVAQLKSQGGQEASDKRKGRWSGRNLLVAAQFALSLALLTTAGLFVRGAAQAASSDPGYRFDGRAVVSTDAGLGGYDERRGRAAQLRALERVRALPEVSSAAVSSGIAFDVLVESRDVSVAGGQRPPSGAVVSAIGTRYFPTLGLSVQRGRDFTAAEEGGGAESRVAMIDRPLAERLFGAEEAVGRQVVIDGLGSEPWLVVALVPGLRQSLWDKAAVPHVYVPSGQVYRTTSHLHVQFRSGTPVADGLRALRQAVRAADEGLPITAVQTLDEHRNRTTTYWAVQMFAKVFSIFGGLALFLALVGVYSVKAYTVAQRTREIGIRVALGSSPAEVVRLVLEEGLRMNLGALSIGLALGLGIARLVSALLYDVSPFDPLVFTLAPLALTAAMLLACYLPARRASRVEVVAALRIT
jgi:predicted permease